MRFKKAAVLNWEEPVLGQQSQHGLRHTTRLSMHKVFNIKFYQTLPFCVLLQVTELSRSATSSLVKTQDQNMAELIDQMKLVEEECNVLRKKVWIPYNVDVNNLSNRRNKSSCPPPRLLSRVPKHKSIGGSSLKILRCAATKLNGTHLRNITQFLTLMWFYFSIPSVKMAKMHLHKNTLYFTFSVIIT